MGTFLEGILTEGILSDYYEKVIYALVHKVDLKTHVRSFMGKYDENICNFAEPEFSGKYLDLCCKIYERYQNEKALKHAEMLVQSILEYMDEEGYIGCLIKGHEFHAFSVWNQMFTIMGLLSFYRVTGRKDSLEAAMRCADYVMLHFMEKGEDLFDCLNNGVQHSCILYVLPDLYELTKEERYKNDMTYIINRFRHSDLNFLEFTDIFALRSQKGIEILLILMGILKYAVLCGDAGAIESVKRYWKQVWDTQIRNTGNATMNEVWTKNGNAAAMLDKEQKPNETCVAVGWIELSLCLFDITKEAQYLNAIDKSLYNHILAFISENGDDFAYYQPNYGKKIRTTGQGLYKCCRYRGFTLFTYMPQMLMYMDDKCMIPMIYTNAEFETDGIKIEEKNNYPFENAMQLTISSEHELDTELCLRVPEDYEISEIYLNEQPISLCMKNGYATIKLQSQRKYKIEWKLDAKIVVEHGMIENQSMIAVRYGQVLLALKDEEGKISLSKEKLYFKRSKGDSYLCFDAIGYQDGKERNVEFTDYASADGYRVWIPIIE